MVISYDGVEGQSGQYSLNLPVPFWIEWMHLDGRHVALLLMAFKANIEILLKPIEWSRFVRRE